MSSCNKPLNLCRNSLYPKEQFWLDNIKDLYQNNNYIKFVPKYEMTRIEQLNSVTRLCLYFIVLIIIFNKNIDWLYIPITVIILCVILYYINENDGEGKRKELNKILQIRKEKKDHLKDLEDIELTHDGDEHFEIDIDDKKYDKKGREFELQSGYNDSDGILNVGPKYGPSKSNDNESLYTMDELVDYQKNTCRRPSSDNPFMNTDVTEYNTGDPPVACNADDEEVNDEINVNFNHELFRDVDELWERKNSQRQFYTMPNTAVPNNQVEFAKWLYYIPKTCKEDSVGCLRYVDLRSNRDPNPI